MFFTSSCCLVPLSSWDRLPLPGGDSAQTHNGQITKRINWKHGTERESKRAREWVWVCAVVAGCLGVTKSILEPLTLAKVVTLQRPAEVMRNERELQWDATGSEYLLDLTKVLVCGHSLYKMKSGSGWRHHSVSWIPSCWASDNKVKVNIKVNATFLQDVHSEILHYYPNTSSCSFAGPVWNV